jgi:hypothetical protein
MSAKHKLNLHGPYPYDEIIRKNKSFMDGAVGITNGNTVIVKCGGEWFFVEDKATNKAETELHKRLVEIGSKPNPIVEGIVITYSTLTDEKKRTHMTIETVTNTTDPKKETVKEPVDTTAYLALDTFGIF